MAILVLASPIAVLCVLALFNGRVGVPVDFAESAARADPPAPLAEPVTLKVVTFNIQDLYLRGRDRPLRMRSIGAKLLILDPDLVAFQEAFIEADRAVLLKELENTRLQHHRYYPSGLVGSGLLVASAFPIEEVWFHRFSVSNPAYKVWEGDWWAGKGVALARVRLPGGGMLDLYNTHAQAGYGNPAYDIVREQQMAELARFVNESRLGAHPALVAGDLNCRPGDPAFETAVEGAKLQRVLAGDSGVDHIFAAKSPRYRYTMSATEPIEATVKLGDRTLSLSDHTGYMSTLTIHPAERGPSD